MADEPVSIDLGLADDGTPVILVGDEQEAADMAALLRLQPGLVAVDRATDLARAVNHFAHGSEYDVITDPPGFAAAYRARLAKEDPNAPWQEGVIRLCDFGIPDFATIHPPAHAGGKLVFFAVDAVLGLPYRVEAADPAGPPVYTPLGLTPVASAIPAGTGSGLTPAQRPPAVQTRTPR